jgi:hypothetical protein
MPIMSHKEALTFVPKGKIKFHLRRIRVNSKGYDSDGFYHGTGAPLWYALRVNERVLCKVFRAESKAQAKALLKAKYPSATFFGSR